MIEEKENMEKKMKSAEIEVPFEIRDTQWWEKWFFESLINQT